MPPFRPPHLRPVILGALALLVAVGSSPAGPSAPPAAPPPPSPRRPALVVLLVVDQLRADRLDRYADLYLPPGTDAEPGGFRYLMERGARWIDAHHDHFPVDTCPGHAAITTGALPYRHGISGNSWYDAALGRKRECAEDPNAPLVGPGAEGKGLSARSLRSTTIGDELKIATAGGAKVWSIAPKDRAAVMLGGHLADGVVWWDDAAGAWVSSRAWAKDGRLPAWIAERDARREVDALFGRSWTPLLPDAMKGRAWSPDGRHVVDHRGLGTSFPHRLDGGLDRPGRNFYKAFRSTPWIDEIAVDMVRDAVSREGLGADATPDLLAVGLCSNDEAGHWFGPDSPEALDLAVRADRRVADLLKLLARAVPGGLSRVTIALTADHGVAPLTGALKEAGFPAGAWTEASMRGAVDAALDASIGPADWVTLVAGAGLWLSDAAIEARRAGPPRARSLAAAAAARLPGVAAAFSRDDVLAGRVPPTDTGRKVAAACPAGTCPDVLIVPEILWVMSASEKGTEHGGPYAYNSAVPILLAGPGVRPGLYTQRASTLDIAPTLAAILGILPPAGSEGRILGEGLELR